MLLFFDPPYILYTDPMTDEKKGRLCFTFSLSLFHFSSFNFFISMVYFNSFKHIQLLNLMCTHLHDYIYSGIYSKYKYIYDIF